ncbi:MAG: hypothetical protein D6736_04380 [Nitrospinota bacterium]|nr:MAG: hypothetical protein D6736_04380 [Nitrospinota bacterium]
MVRKIEILNRNEFWEGLGFQGMEIQIILDALKVAIPYYDTHQMSHKAQMARDLLRRISAPSPLKTTSFA